MNNSLYGELPKTETINQAPVQKVGANDAISRILMCINNNRTEDAYIVAESYLKGFTPDSKAVQGIRNAIRRKPMTFQTLKQLAGSSVYVDVYEINDLKMYLEGATEILLQNLKKEYKNLELLRTHNLPPRTRILLYGSTGNGKTTFAKYIAQTLQLPFLSAKHSELIKSTMGSSGAAISNLFSAVKEPCVLFFDEFDSLASERNTKDGGDVKAELDRAQNVLLMKIDELPDEVILIAATNFGDKIDPAIKRRFQIKHEMPNPSLHDKQLFLQQLIQYHDVEPGNESRSKIINTSASYADIKSLYQEIIRNILLK